MGIICTKFTILSLTSSTGFVLLAFISSISKSLISSSLNKIFASVVLPIPAFPLVNGIVPSLNPLFYLFLWMLISKYVTINCIRRYFSTQSSFMSGLPLFIMYNIHYFFVGCQRILFLFGGSKFRCQNIIKHCREVLRFK